ncbi:MAG TPA: TetR family transcriptional regulator [Longimicrobiales bacterium]|nr:TetR family transcriptional regulator [Longimicrobiales bacterium]
MNYSATSETTENRLIETAIRLFAHHGFHGTSIRRITREAGANLGAVTYHFGGKRELYEQALVACIGPLAARLGGVAAGGGSALGRLEEALGVFVDYLAERPELPQLMLQETVAGRRPPAAALALLQGVLGALAGVIREGQAAGEIRAGDPRLLAVSVVSQPLHLTMTTRVFEGLEPGDAETRARLLEHARAFIRHGLEPTQSAEEEER